MEGGVLDVLLALPHLMHAHKKSVRLTSGEDTIKSPVHLRTCTPGEQMVLEHVLQVNYCEIQDQLGNF